MAALSCGHLFCQKLLLHLAALAHAFCELHQTDDDNENWPCNCDNTSTYHVKRLKEEHKTNEYNRNGNYLMMRAFTVFIEHRHIHTVV
jgi:hypothetical protein